MRGRTIAIGDIHGCSAALSAVLQAVQPRPEDTIITLGDYVDRGPDSAGAIEQLLVLGRQTHLVPLLGNHDQMCLLICDGRQELLGDWRLFGGVTTLDSYGGRVPEGMPPEHLHFLQNCRLYYEVPGHFFVHGNYETHLPLDQQPPETLLWVSLKLRRPGPHCSGKTAIVGHTAQKNGEIFDLGYLKCIDTCCYGSGWLTAMDVETGQLWQANKEGAMRRK